MQIKLDMIHNYTVYKTVIILFTPYIGNIGNHTTETFYIVYIALCAYMYEGKVGCNIHLYFYIIYINMLLTYC